MLTLQNQFPADYIIFDQNTNGHDSVKGCDNNAQQQQQQRQPVKPHLQDLSVKQTIGFIRFEIVMVDPDKFAKNVFVDEHNLNNVYENDQCANNLYSWYIHWFWF
jgi:hypothetical protein